MTVPSFVRWRRTRSIVTAGNPRATVLDGQEGEALHCGHGARPVTEQADRRVDLGHAQRGGGQVVERGRLFSGRRGAGRRLPQGGRQLPGHQGGRQQQHQSQQLVRPPHRQGAGRRHEEEVVGEDRGHTRERSREDAMARAQPEHQHQVDHREVGDGIAGPDQPDHRRDHDDARERVAVRRQAAERQAHARPTSCRGRGPARGRAAPRVGSSGCRDSRSPRAARWPG